MPLDIITTALSGVRGTHRNAGSDYVYYVKQDAAPGSPAGIYRVRVTPYEILYTGNTTFSTVGVSLMGPSGGPGNSVKRTAVVVTGGSPSCTIATISPAPASLAAIAPTGLSGPGYTYTASQPLLTPGFYAAKLASNNYAVFRVYVAPPPALPTIRIEWITYKLSQSPDLILSPALTNPRDILISDDETFAYVTGATGVVQLPRYNSISARLPQFGDSSLPEVSYQISDPLTNPQQMAIHEGMVYVVDQTGLWRIDPPIGVTTKLFDGFSGATGLLIDGTGAGARAYVSDAAGDVYRLDLPGPGMTPTTPASVASLSPVLSLGAATGFMTWLDRDAPQAFYITLRGSQNSVVRVNVDDMSSFTLISPTSDPTAPLNPWSVEALSTTAVFIAANTTLAELDFSLPLSDILLLGIGHIPFDRVNQSDPVTALLSDPNIGRADTSVDPGYFFQVQNVAFGGNLNLMVNHEYAWIRSFRSYEITLIRYSAFPLPSPVSLGTPVSTTPVTNQFGDYKWNPALAKFELQYTGATPRYPVRNPDDMWYNPYLGAILQTTSAHSGLAGIKVDFYYADGSLGDSVTRLILIDNDRCYATLALPRIGTPGSAPPSTPSSLQCGCLSYASKDDRVEIDYTAWQQNQFARYSLYGYRGGTPLLAVWDFNQPVDAFPDPHIKNQSTTSATPLRVGHLTGNCNVAGVALYLSVPSTVTNGLGPVNLGAYRSLYFTLVPSTTTLEQPPPGWIDPGGP